MSAKRAKVFWTGRSQAVRLPKEFRFESATVIVSRNGRGILLLPADEWPERYVESFVGSATDLERPRQGKHERRKKI